MKQTQQIRNSMMFHDYYSRLKNIAVSIFKWTDLPETCNARFLEDTLFHYGRAVFVRDPEMDYLNLRVTPFGTLNVYNEPVAFTAYGIGYNKVYSKDECVYIRNNPTEKSTESTIIMYAERLAEIDLAMITNIKAQKTPVLIRCDEKTRTSLKVVYEQYDGNMPVIFGSKSLSEKPLEVLATGAPFVADKLREEKRAIWNEAFEYLGINSNPSDNKRERLIKAEVNSNNEQIDIQNLTMLGCRQKACEEINDMFGLDVGVALRVEELKSIWDYGARLWLNGDIPDDAMSEFIGRQEGVENGSVYDRITRSR